ncbi:MAG: hypothetical protein ABDH49_09170, partial [Candidatus Hydrothermales bacterium]
GISKWYELFTPRQLLALLTFTKWVRRIEEVLRNIGYEENLIKAIVTFLALIHSYLSNFLSTVCRWQNNWEVTTATFSRQAIPMTWDFSEINTITSLEGWSTILRWTTYVIKEYSSKNISVQKDIIRASATELPYTNNFFDAIITDPPYYDNISYAALSDFFYVWLKRSIGHLYPEHFSGELTPKKKEIIADAKRHGSREKARRFYEEMMEKSLGEAWRVLKPNSPMVLIYAHKTTAGWSTLVEALRKSGFVIQEAWPIHTERPGRLLEIGSSALASSIFLVARKRERGKIGS